MGFRRSLTIFISGLSCVGCAKPSGTPRWDSFPVTLYAQAGVLATADAERDFTDAMSFWEARAGRRLFDFRGTYAGGQPFTGSYLEPTKIFANVILGPNPWPLTAGVAGQTSFLYDGGSIEGAIVMINQGGHLCTGDCPGAYYATSRRKVMAHELGHFLGLAHSGTVSNIMFNTIQPGGTLDTVTIDQGALAELTR